MHPFSVSRWKDRVAIYPRAPNILLLTVVIGLCAWVCGLCAWVCGLCAWMCVLCACVCVLCAWVCVLCAWVCGLCAWMCVLCAWVCVLCAWVCGLCAWVCGLLVRQKKTGIGKNGDKSGSRLVQRTLWQRVGSTRNDEIKPDYN